MLAASLNASCAAGPRTRGRSSGDGTPCAVLDMFSLRKLSRQLTGRTSTDDGAPNGCPPLPMSCDCLTAIPRLYPQYPAESAKSGFAFLTPSRPENKTAGNERDRSGTKRNEPAGQNAYCLVERRVRFPAAPPFELRKCKRIRATSAPRQHI